MKGSDPKRSADQSADAAYRVTWARKGFASTHVETVAARDRSEVWDIVRNRYGDVYITRIRRV